MSAVPARKPAVAKLPAVVSASMISKPISILLRKRQKNLNLTMQHQAQTNWCWAAVSTSVALFYQAGSTWTQCKVVNAELGQTTCCQNGSSAACNVPWYLDKALTRVGHFKSFANGSLADLPLMTEIDGGRPIGVRIGWSGGGGHFVAIDGYVGQPIISLNQSVNTVSVRDPWYGSSTYSLSAFKTSYQSTGSWTHTYQTKA